MNTSSPYVNPAGCVAGVYGSYDSEIVGGGTVERIDEPGKRYDVGKLRYDLLPPDALEQLVLVYTKGAEKYADRNWEKGMSWSRCFGPLMRHAWAFWRGEELDRESGLPHMAHAAWNCLALIAYTMRKIGNDDRVR
jgi:Domain of unknown function (DUF5664)